MTSDLSQLGLLLFVSALVAMLSRRLRLPYTVGLVLAGMALYFSHVYLKWHLSRELIFSVFLPLLVFEAALFIPWDELRRDLPVVGSLATLGVVLAAGVTAIGVHYGLDWDWASAIVFGVLIAATDPVSVIATFKEAKVPFVANSLIFLLIGAQEAQQHFKDLWAPVVAAIVLVMVGRAIAIYPLCGLFAGSSEQKSLLNQCVAMPHPEISREYGGLSTSITFGTEIKGRPCRA